MKFSLFYHSLVSDWNHGNAHFLRGIASELLARGHQVKVYEPGDGWSLHNLIADHRLEPLQRFHQAYPKLESQLYRKETLNLEEVAADSDIIIVHEWNEPWLVNDLGKLRNGVARGDSADMDFRLLFHDTHHRAVSDPGWIKRFNLENYDGILAFGEVLSDVYRTHGWNDYVWTWHEAADIRTFYPHASNNHHPKGDLVWVGNWGDDERTRELETFLFGPVRDLNLKCHLYGVRYPAQILKRLTAGGVDYRGWLANFDAPDVFANHKVTVHVPRRYYTQTLPGIPTIRPFEAMACGIPLVSAPWEDSEHLFTPGEDFLVARDGDEMRKHLRNLLSDPDYAQQLAARALLTIHNRHTCGHRVDQLMDIIETLSAATQEPILPIKNTTGGSAHAYL